MSGFLQRLMKRIRENEERAKMPFPPFDLSNPYDRAMHNRMYGLGDEIVPADAEIAGGVDGQGGSSRAGRHSR